MPSVASTSHKVRTKVWDFLADDLSEIDLRIQNATVTAPTILLGKLKIPLDQTTGSSQVDLNQAGWPIDDVLSISHVFSIDVITADLELRIGAASAQNVDPDAIAQSAWFKITASGSTPIVAVETDDGTIDNNDELTGIVIPVATPLVATIDFSSGIQSISVPGKSKGGTGSVQFSLGDARGYKNPVKNLTKHMDMSGYTGGIAPYFHAEKIGASGNIIVTLHEISMEYRVW